MKDVLKKLQDARKTLHAMELKKTGFNKFAGYAYFELADFLVPVQRIFSDIGICGVVSFATEQASLTITDLESGEAVTITSPMSSAALKGCHEVQNLGAVQTYLRRYLWVAALEIVEHDAIDSAPPKEDKKPEKPAAQKSVAAEAFGNLDVEEQEYLRNLHRGVMEASDMYMAYELAKESLDSEEQVAFWSLFDSKQRAALKKAKATHDQLEVAGQA